MRKQVLISFAASAIITGFLFVGCSGSSNDTGGDVSSSLSGVAVDGYLEDAKVWADFNANSVEDAGETTTTDKDGKFSFSTLPTAQIVVSISGGFDTGVEGAPAFEGILKTIAEKDVTNVVASPITTLVAEAVSSGSTLLQAKSDVATSMKLSQTDIMLDPVAVSSTKPDVLKKALMIAKATELAANDNVSYEAVCKAIAKEIKTSQTKIADAVSPTKLKENNTTLAITATDAQMLSLTDSIQAITTIDNAKNVESAVVVAKTMLKENANAKVNISKIKEIIVAMKAEAGTTKELDLANLGNAIKNEDTTTDLDVATIVSSYKDACLDAINGENHLFYGETNHAKLGSIKNIRILNTENVSSPLFENNALITTSRPVPTIGLKYNIATNTYTELNTKSVHYVTGVTPYKVDLAKVADTAPSEVATSNIVFKTGTTPVFTGIDYLGTKQYLVGQNTSGVNVLVTSDMGADTTPIAFANKALWTVSYPKYGADVSGYITYDSATKTIQKCTTDMQTCTDIKTVSATPKFYGDIVGTTCSAFLADSKLYKLDKNSGIATEITTPAALLTASSSAINGGDLYYIGSSDETLNKINIATGTETKLATDDSEFKFSRFHGFTNNWVIYGSDMHMRAVKKDGTTLTPKALSTTTITEGHKYVTMGVGEQFLYVTYKLSDGVTSYKAHIFKDDGTETYKADSFWAAVITSKKGTLNFKSSYIYTPEKFIRVDNTDSYGGGTLKAVSPTNPFEDGLTLGTMPTYNFQTFLQNYYYFNKLITSDGNVIIYAKDDKNVNNNAFLLNVNEANSLINLTNEAPPSEETVGTASTNAAHCHGRHCMVCHNFAGGKIYEDKNATKIATGYNVKIGGITARLGKGQGENFNLPIEEVTAGFKVTVFKVSDGSEIKKSITTHDKSWVNCNFCHDGKGVRLDAPNVITIEK